MSHIINKLNDYLYTLHEKSEEISKMVKSYETIKETVNIDKFKEKSIFIINEVKTASEELIESISKLKE